MNFLIPIEDMTDMTDMIDIINFLILIPIFVNHRYYDYNVVKDKKGKL